MPTASPLGCPDVEWRLLRRKVWPIHRRSRLVIFAFGKRHGPQQLRALARCHDPRSFWPQPLLWHRTKAPLLTLR